MWQSSNLLELQGPHGLPRIATESCRKGPHLLMSTVIISATGTVQPHNSIWLRLLWCLLLVACWRC